MSQADDILKHRDDLFVNVLNAQRVLNTKIADLEEINNSSIKFKKEQGNKKYITDPLHKNHETLVSIRKNHEKTSKGLQKFVMWSAILIPTIKIIADKIKDLKIEGLSLSDSIIGKFQETEIAPEYSHSEFSKKEVTLGKVIDLSNAKVSEKGKRLISGSESCILYTYDDKDAKHRFIQPGDSYRGKLTIGWGHTANVRPGMRITQEEADKLFEQDMKWAENQVKKRVKVPITQEMFDALVSLVYNSGPGNKETLWNKLNSGDYKGAQDAFALYNKQKNQETGQYEVNQGLVNRRNREAQLFGQTSISQVQPNIQSNTAYSKNLSYATGQQFGGYKLKNSGVKVTNSMASYLQQVRGSGVITSGSEINQYHYWKKGGGYSSKHVLGNKIDVRTNDTRNAYELAQRVIPFMEHPATIMINFEYIKLNVYNETLQIIKNSRPDLYQRIGKDLKVVNTKPSNSSGTQHLDIEIDPNKLKKTEIKMDNYTIQNKNSTNAENNTKKAKLPDEDKKENKTADNKINKNLFIKEKDKRQSQLQIANLINFSDIRKTTEEQEQKDRISSII